MRHALPASNFTSHCPSQRSARTQSHHLRFVIGRGDVVDVDRELLWSLLLAMQTRNYQRSHATRKGMYETDVVA
jgi:hypothetical protein